VHVTDDRLGIGRGQHDVRRLGAAHDITGAGIWTTALVLMAFGQVLARLAVLPIRRSLVSSQPSARQGRIAAVPQHATR
jgi:hypothetical protein